MDASSLELPVQTSWDARISVPKMIQWAEYAVLKDQQVVLVAKTTDQALCGVVLTFEQGLHYDGDSTIKKSYAQKKIESGEWAVTVDWARAEDHLR